MDIMDQICDISAEADYLLIPCGTGLCRGPKISTIICLNVALTAKYVWVGVKTALHTNYISLVHKYEIATLGPGETYDTYTHAKNTANQL